MFLAFLFIFIGVVFFLKNAGLVQLNWGVIWPLFVIGIGVYMVIGIHRLSEKWKRFWQKMIGRINK